MRLTTAISGWRRKTVPVNTRRSAIPLHRPVRICVALRFCGSAIRPPGRLWLPQIVDHRVRLNRSIGKPIRIQFRIMTPHCPRITSHDRQGVMRGTERSLAVAARGYPFRATASRPRCVGLDANATVQWPAGVDFPSEQARFRRSTAAACSLFLCVLTEARSHGEGFTTRRRPSG